MNRKTFGIETGQPERILKKIAEEETAQVLNPTRKQAKELFDKYNDLMANYVEVEDSNPVLANLLLEEANEILLELNTLDHQGLSIPSTDQLAAEADELTRNKLSKREFDS